MRLLPIAVFSLTLYAASALAQQSPPLPAYVPPPSAAPLAPLPGSAAANPAPPANLGDVRLNSNDAANISAADTRSLLAPALPVPDAAGQGTSAYLAAAKTAIATNQTGAAQEALERAETRALTRDVAPADAADPSHSPLIQAINAARQALSVDNPTDAQAHIATALGLLAPAPH